MNGSKKLIVRTLIIFYGISYFLQNTFFVDRKKVYAAENPSTTNLVAVFVDKDIYQGIKNNLERYTTTYIQKKIANSKAIVLPIDTKTLKAYEISKMLENMYFEGLKDESSKLVGTILIGDIPLPVVENNGYIYPSIFPYVDFENQEFVYDANKKFFVYNNNPNGQAELWHGIIKFDTTSEYNTFFNKVKGYTTNPTQFIDKAIWYDDFIGLKKYFIPENTKYYINNMIFSEDLGYHRYTNLLVNTLKTEHNDASLNAGNQLGTDIQDTTDPDLKNYATDMESRNSTAAGLLTDTTPTMPTMTLQKATQEMLKTYDGLTSTLFLSKIKDNIAGLARRYKTTSGETFDDYNSTTDKVVQKDNRILGDTNNNVQPLLIQMNDYLENGLNTKIAQEKYYMNVAVPVSELDFQGGIKIPPTFWATGLPLPKCVRTKYNYYENYYFGTNANQLIAAQQTSAYRGTFQNLTGLEGQNINNTGQTIGGSYKIFSTQVEANRGYNINNTQEEVDKYAQLKINKQDLWKRDCNLHLFGYCIRWEKTWKPDDSADSNKCNLNDTNLQGGCESLTDFSARYRGGASPLNTDPSTQRLANYNYRNAIFPIFDIAGSKKINNPETAANSYIGVEKYASIVQKRFAVSEKQETKYSNIYSFINNPNTNGIDLKFTNQIVTNTDLEHPTRAYNPPKTYAQENFFSLYTTMQSHIAYGGKAILYNRTAPTDVLNCNPQGQVYTYKTIDSRIENIAPTRNQISDTDFYKFKNGSDLEVFYNNVMVSLAQTKSSITDKDLEFSGTDSNNYTGVIANLAKLKSLVTTYNNGTQQITTFNPLSLLSYSAAQVTQLADTRSGSNLNTQKSAEMTGRIAVVKKGVDDLYNYIAGLNLSNVQANFDAIIQSESLKKQKVEILDTWKTNMNQNFDYITNNINALKATFAQARSIENTVGQLSSNILLIQAQKIAITALYAGNGCSSSNFGAVCNVLTNIISTLQADLTDINDGLTRLHLYNDNGSVQPFVDINTAFSPPAIFGDIAQLKTTINGFDISTDPNKQEKNRGMNLTTPDRPIDNIRNITFQGIGGDQVRLNYPNVYEVKIYNASGDKLLLKTPDEIRESIKTYLTDKALEYNALLQTQQNKRDAYYMSLSAQFNLLGQIDPLANPNTHTYNLIPTDYFISQLVAFLDGLETGYGGKYVYGSLAHGTIDQKLDMLAKLLYYQNITWPERLQKSTVVDDMNEIKNSFDVNTKISHVMQTYLTENNDQGKFLTPVYNKTGYEVGYINSDGQDYVSAKTVPSFIQQIQTVQAKRANIVPIPTNTYNPQSASDNLQKKIDSCDGVDTNGTSLLFDFKTFTSPWMKAMVCRSKQIFKFDVKVSFDNALGPVAMGSLDQAASNIDTAGTQRKKFGSQRTAPNNDDTINQAQGNLKDTLQGYNTYALPQFNTTTISVEDTGNNQLTIGMAQNVGAVNVKISATGDNCFGISKNGVILSSNICTKAAKELYNPNTDTIVFDIIAPKKTAGSTAIKIDLCPPVANATQCITKTQVIQVLPGPTRQITLTAATDIVMAGSQIPLIISAKDKYDNTIGQSIQAYTISVNSGDGQIYDGAATNNSIKFDNFRQAGFIYQAPIQVNANKSVSISIAPEITNPNLITSTTPPPQVITKKIIVAKGIITVLKDNIVLYQTENAQSIQPKITFDLPKDESGIQYVDTNGIVQINPNTIPKISIKVEDKNGNKLETVANIISKQGLLSPGTVIQSTVNNQIQQSFNKANDFIIKDGRLDIALYPNFKAGDDTITIYIPGIDPIIIPVTVNAGDAKTVLLTLDKSRMDLTTDTGSEGMIQVVDTRNNKVTKPTTIKLGVIGTADANTNEFIYSGAQYTYKLTAKKPGGEGYVFAYIKDRQLSDQVPGYERFIIQESILPKDKLNIMYLNLFGTDRGNQRGYFSENNKIVNTITNQSDKLLATTTELIDPSKIKQIEYIIGNNGQIQSINNKAITLTIDNKEIIGQLADIAKIHLGTSSDFKIQTLTDSGAMGNFAKDTNTLLYIPEPTDSVITDNTANKTTITINGSDILDLTQGTIDPNITITADNEMIADMETYTMTLNGKTIGKLLIRNNDGITTNTANIDLQDPITYGKTSIFTEGSSNTQGIGIFVTQSSFIKNGYQSIEDSSDALLGIGFTSNFKNISNFANGKNVGEATLPYGSQFLINFGDPLLERREKNPNIPTTDFDAAFGQTIYADPNKTIFKVLPIDFNKDGFKDLIVIYTDGTIKLLKNYGGTQSYKNMQELMIIAEAIKDVKIGDVDGNGYDDILILTTNNKGIVYLNKGGVFAVDGRNICLNTSVEPGVESQTPDDFSTIKQLFIQDMDKDGTLDVVTNDNLGDVKIFYGGGNSNGANYLSSITGACDANRYTRQQNKYITVQRFGIKINSNRYIQDDSLVYRKGSDAPTEGTTEELDTTAPETPGDKAQAMSDIKDLMGNTDTYVAAGNSQLAYVQNPLTTVPVYETKAPGDIYYLPIGETNDAVSVYKQYSDINGGILRNNDEVAIQTTIVSKKNNNKLTYIDKLKGPWNIAKDSNNRIPSFVFTTANTRGITLDRNAPEGYQFVMDNITLDSGDKLSFSYTVTYQETATTTIDVADQDLSKQNKRKDTYPDITINSTDSCQKNKRIFFNDNIGTRKSYTEVYNDIQGDMNDYYSGAKANQQNMLNGLIDQISNVTNMDGISSIVGTQNLENRQPKNLLNSLPSSIVQNGVLNVDLGFIDTATANVSKKMDSALQGLCQGFKLGKGGSCGIPVPFNQAFLAPGDYHIFGCVPKPPNPLAAVFKTLNNTLGKGMPLLNIPGNRGPTAIGYIPAPGIFGYPFKGATDGFYLGNLGGTYPSMFRLYVAPTLTLGLGMAMCFGPYTVGKALPKPFRDIGGNCIVFALPPLTASCSTSANAPGTSNQPNTDSYDQSMVDSARGGVCNNPPKIGNAIVFAPNSNQPITTNTASSPFQTVSANITAANSSENSIPYSAAIPQGNFGGLIAIDQEPTSVPAAEQYGNATQQLAAAQTSYDGYDLKKGDPINLKILGGKAKGIVQCVVSKRVTSQLQYIQNNLTKMTIEIDLPDITTVFQGFDQIGNFTDTYQNLNAQNQKAGYIQSSTSTGVKQREDKLSKQQYNNITQKAGQNPFLAVQQMFSQVPLVQIDTKDINIKIPAITSDDIKKYQSYLTLRVAKNNQTINDRGTFLTSITALCSLPEIKDKINNAGNTAKQLTDLQTLQTNGKLSPAQQTQLDQLTTAQKQTDFCLKFGGQVSKFVAIRENSAGLISSIKENMKVLDNYKKFPTQLYARTHVTDTYLTEISSLLSTFVGNTMNRLNTNATRFSQYVDAITLLVGAIKTWQAIIDFSVNRSEKCSKCSNDNYGSFSCSLSFLCPKLPIFPIPAFKIPNIYMDLSHVELGMNIVLPKINFVPIKIPLPQIPNLPEPPQVAVNRDVLYGLDINFFKDMSLPTVPVMPEPPVLPEPPSFIPTIKMNLPVLPPAPKIPKILPEINAILKVATFIGKIFCIVKGGIGLVGEKGVKGKIEQITQRTWNVPIFDYFDLTTKFKTPPLQGFDYKMDAYTTLKFNFDGVYDIFNTIAQTTNNMVSKQIEAPIQKTVNQTTNTLNNNAVTSGVNTLPINNINIQGYYSPKEESGMMDYNIAYAQLKEGLINFKNRTIDDTETNKKVRTILATIDNKSTVLPATKELQQMENAAQQIIDKNRKNNQTLEKQIQSYDTFIKKIQGDDIALVSDKTLSVSLKSSLLTIDAPTQKILQSQEDPTKTYLALNQRMVKGYLDAVNNDGPEKLNMTQSTYDKSKQYLETTKAKIDQGLLAYADQPLLAQSTSTTCTNCATNNDASNYSSDLGAYVNGVFVESYSGTQKSMINTVASPVQVQSVQQTYTTTTDLNNDKISDILMYDANTIYVKYAKQNSESLTQGGNSIAIHYNKFYSYETAHQSILGIFGTNNRYISSLDQLANNTDAYGYLTINDITIKVMDKNQEVKNFKTDGQTFDHLQMSWKNNITLGDKADGYVLKISTKIDTKDTPKSFWDFLLPGEKPQYVIVLPQGTDYKKGLITIDENLVKKPINLQLGENVLAVEYYQPDQDKITVTLKNLPRKRLYTSIATLSDTPQDLSNSQQQNFTLYKKSSAWSNQTVAGMQNLGDTNAPVGEILLWRDATQEAVSTGVAHEGYINTAYTFKSLRTDDVDVAKMVIQHNGQTILEKDNQGQTGTIDLSGLFFTGTTQQSFDFIAIDQNGNTAKETVTLNIKIPDIEVIDVKKTGTETSNIIAKISNDLDEGNVLFQRLRNGVRNTITGSNANSYGGYDLTPKQTIITGGIFTLGNTVGLYDTQGNEIGTVDPKTGEIKVNQGYTNTIKIYLNLTSHIPVVELRDITKGITLFQIVLPVDTIANIEMNQGKPNYEQALLQEGQFGNFDGGYCIKDNTNNCIAYSNTQGAIYIPGSYASSLAGEYAFDAASKKTKFIIKDPSNQAIVTFTVNVKPSK